MRTAGIIIAATALAAGVTIIKVLYEVGKEMNQFRTCMSGQNRKR